MNYNGLVMKVTGKNYDVQDRFSGKIYPCWLGVKLPIQQYRLTNPISVGDFVECTFSLDSPSVITAVATPQNHFIRRSTNLSKEAHVLASNIDQVCIVVSLISPALRIGFLDRSLVIAQWQEIQPIILLNKVDLLPNLATQEYTTFVDTYTKLGYRVISLSTTTDFHVSQVCAVLSGKTTLLLGNSGVGKSSIINAVHPSSDLKVGEISSYHNMGKHTTTFSEMIQLSSDTYIIDTPGIKSLGIIGIEKNQYHHYFPEMAARSSDCRMRNCTHIHENECAIRCAVQRGEISTTRFDSYVSIVSSDNNKYR